MSNRAGKKPKTKKKRQKTELVKRNISPIGVVLAIATLLGVPAAMVAFVPRLTVTVSDPVDPGNPFSASVTVANTGYLPLNSVRPFFGLRKMTFGDPAKPTTFLGPPGDDYVRLSNTLWHPVNLGLDDKRTFGLNELWGKQPTLLSANIAILVDYQIPVVRIRREKTFPFSAVKQTNGRFYWYAEAP